MTVSPRLRLIVAAALFFGWMAWLGYAAVSKSHGPVVSRAQAAGATQVIEAKIEAGADHKPQPTVTVVQSLKGDLKPGTTVEVINLDDAAGFAEAGNYLLLLSKSRTSDAYQVVGPQRSPGDNLVGKPVIYPWAEGVPEQAAHLFSQE